MRRLAKSATACALILCLGAVPLRAGQPGSDNAPAAPKAGFRAEVLAELSGIEKKVEDLAGAMPAESYSWRPMEGVRSVGEVYTHIAGSNYLFMSFLGVKSPDRPKPNENPGPAAKEEAIKMLKPSFDLFRTTVLKLADADLDKPTTMFGSPATYRSVLMAQLGHLSEHLGQSIAYARMNHVVPPWTAAEQAKK